jgi:hypothetical protein
MRNPLPCSAPGPKFRAGHGQGRKKGTVEDDPKFCEQSGIVFSTTKELLNPANAPSKLLDSAAHATFKKELKVIVNLIITNIGKTKPQDKLSDLQRNYLISVRTQLQGKGEIYLASIHSISH